MEKVISKLAPGTGKNKICSLRRKKKRNCYKCVNQAQQDSKSVIQSLGEWQILSLGIILKDDFPLRNVWNGRTLHTTAKPLWPQRQPGSCDKTSTPDPAVQWAEN